MAARWDMPGRIFVPYLYACKQFPGSILCIVCRLQQRSCGQTFP